MKAKTKTIIDSKGFFGAVIAGAVALTVGILANLDNVRDIINGPTYKVLVERAEVPLGEKIPFDGVSMVPRQSSGAANAVYFEVYPPGAEMRSTEARTVPAPLHLPIGRNKYVVHLLKLSQAPPKTLTLTIQKKE